MKEIPIIPTAQELEAVEEVPTRQHHDDRTSIECYFHNLPLGSKMHAVVRFRAAWRDWDMVAEHPNSSIMLYFSRLYFTTTGALLAVAVSVGLGVGAAIVVIGEALIPRLRGPRPFELVVALLGVVSVAVLVPTYLISVKFSRYIHD